MQLSKGVRYTARSSKVIALTNHNGMKILLSTLGASWISCLLPMQSGKRDILLGSPNMAAQMDQGVYLGSIVGRAATNSIVKSQFPLAGKDTADPVSLENHYQKSSLDNFSYRVWKVTQISPQEAIFSLESPDGDQGFSGKLHAEVSYCLTNENEVIIRYRTQVDALCPVNLTNHAYFNLAGENSQQTVLEHDLQLAAAHYLPIDENGLPTGEWLPVENSAFDFRNKKRIGYDFLQDDQQKIAGGYHHSIILEEPLTDGESKVASLFSPNGDVQMNIATTMPSIQLYTGNHLISIPGKSRYYTHFSGVALNTQFLPDAVNHPEWEERCRGISQPNKCYQYQTRYQFIF